MDPAVYFTETDRQKQAARDATATVIARNRAAEAAEQRRRNATR